MNFLPQWWNTRAGIKRSIQTDFRFRLQMSIRYRNELFFLSTTSAVKQDSCWYSTSTLPAVGVMVLFGEDLGEDLIFVSKSNRHRSWRLLPHISSGRMFIQSILHMLVPGRSQSFYNDRKCCVGFCLPPVHVPLGDLHSALPPAWSIYSATTVQLNTTLLLLRLSLNDHQLQ